MKFWVDVEGVVHFSEGIYSRFRMKKAKADIRCVRCREVILKGELYRGTFNYACHCSKCSCKFLETLILTMQNPINNLNEQLHKCEIASMEQVKVKNEVYV